MNTKKRQRKITAVGLGDRVVIDLRCSQQGAMTVTIVTEANSQAIGTIRPNIISVKRAAKQNFDR